MATLLRIVIGVLLIAHGLVHLLYLTDEVPEFSLERSRLVPESASRRVAMVLMWATVAAFALLGLAVWSVPDWPGHGPGSPLLLRYSPWPFSSPSGIGRWSSGAH
jgi:hypothetical protein